MACNTLTQHQIYITYLPFTTQDFQKAFVVMFDGLEFYFNRTLKATSPATDLAFNPMSAMSSSLWHKAGRGHAISPSPTLVTIRSAPDEATSLQKESSYSSLQGHADGTDRTHSSHSKSRYTYKNAFDYSEGT